MIVVLNFAARYDLVGVIESLNMISMFLLSQKDLFRLNACIDFKLKRHLVCSDLDGAPKVRVGSLSDFGFD